jgi:hypothetical protein
MFWLYGLAKAEMSAGRWIALHNESNGLERQVYEQFLAGNVNGISWAVNIIKSLNEGQADINYLYCPPSKLAITLQQDINILKRYIKEHPQYADLPLGMVLAGAFKEIFPCKQE